MSLPIALYWLNGMPILLYIFKYTLTPCMHLAHNMDCSGLGIYTDTHSSPLLDGMRRLLLWTCAWRYNQAMHCLCGRAGAIKASHKSLCAGAQRYVGQAIPVLMAGCRDGDANVRQCSAYGMGILAHHHPAAFRGVAPVAIAALLAIITAPGAR